VQPGATIRYLPQEPDFEGHATTLAYAKQVCAGDDHYQPANPEALGLRGDEDLRIVRRRARRTALARVLAPRPISCCWTSDQSSRSHHTNGWKRTWQSPQCARHHQPRPRFLSNLSRSTAWLDRGQIKRSTAALVPSRPGANEVLAEEERDQHKLDRKIVNEEIGCATASPAPQAQPSSRLGIFLRCASSGATIGCCGNAIWRFGSDKSGKLIIEAKGIGRTYGDRRSSRFLDPVQRGDLIGIVVPRRRKTTLIEMRPAAAAGQRHHRVAPISKWRR